MVGDVYNIREMKEIGQSVLLTFTLTVTDVQRKGKDLKYNSTFHNCQIWGNSAKRFCKTVKVGATIYANGVYKINNYTDRAGQKKIWPYLHIDAWQMLYSPEAPPKEVTNADIKEAAQEVFQAKISEELTAEELSSMPY